MILTILNPKSSLIKINIDFLIYKLLEQSNIYIEKFKKLNSKIFSGDVNHLYEPRSFLKSLISSARKNPFIFLKQIENKFNIIINYEIKYRTSICIENFMKYFKGEEHIIEKEPHNFYSYINAEEIGCSYLLIKEIYNNLINNNQINNNAKKKGNKMIKNISASNMEFLYGLKNIDNFSLLNRSIIQNRNSNFHIMNSSKEKPKKYKYNKVPFNTEANSNKNFLLSNDNDSNNNNNLNERNDKNKVDTYLSGSNFTSSKNNIGSESTNNNVYEFGDEESEKSNYSFEESNLPPTFNKKRNTTNNNSKFNLNNMNKFNNDSSTTSKTLNTMKYNTNTTNSSSNNINLNNKVYKGKNLVINSKNSSDSSGMSYNVNNINRNNFWNSLFNEYHLKFPGNLYKVYNQDLKLNLPIYKYLSMYYSFYSFSPYSSNYFFSQKNNLSNNPNEDHSKISLLLNKQKQILENMFSDMISINQNSVYILINFYIYYFFNF